MLARIRRRRRKASSTELDITAFMNLMVILVPFLLITAVFSRVTVLDLYLPPESSGESLTQNRFQLEIVIHKDDVVIHERGSRFTRKIESNKNGYDFKALADTMATLKQRFPARRDATILAEPDTEYDTLVQVMDAVRMRANPRGSESAFEEMFPDISIGDAPGGAS
ncbi:MAG: biopolymer transporter ExbD [Gammaproteobacteria bacterium]|nr:biopolymer transporter ExbD [Gammaproteobacteria bacterium]